MLVEYGSDEEGQAIEQPLAVEDDNEEAAFDPEDAFGVGSISKTSKATGHASGKATARSAPEVLINDPSASQQSLITRPSDQVVFYNPTYADLGRPVEGPANPWSEKKLVKQNTITGHVEQHHMSASDFEQQQRTFQAYGYAANPTSYGGFVGDLEAAAKNGGDFHGQRKPTRKEQRAIKRKRKGKGQLGEFDDSADEEEEEEEGGEGEEDGQPRKKKEKVQKEYIGPWAGWDGEEKGWVQPSQEEWEEQAEAGGPPVPKRQKPVIEPGTQIGFGEEKSVFHGKEQRDYLGRSYLHIPNDVDVNLRPSEPGLQECFVPKRVVHTWSGHTKGVARVQLFPGSGHLILSGSLDTRVKLWDVYHEGKCLRTFMGHTKAVHDVTFNNSGDKFLSAAFDRQMKLWDTESGACLKAFSNGKIPYCIKFHPEHQDIFLAGMGDKKVAQYDMRSGELVQEYDQHLGAVNTITFVDENRRFVTTSDDKTIRVWDYDIPVVIKYIAEPSMHSMPAVGVHPSNKWLAMQSLDNQILIFGADSFKQNRKKRFAGHTIAGYACEPHWSPDGRFLSSGDGAGNMVFWDYKTSRILSRLKVHNAPIISHAWLPHETSKVVTSSWDNTIKLLD